MSSIKFSLSRFLFSDGVSSPRGWIVIGVVLGIGLAVYLYKRRQTLKR